MATRNRIDMMLVIEASRQQAIEVYNQLLEKMDIYGVDSRPVHSRAFCSDNVDEH